MPAAAATRRTPSRSPSIPNILMARTVTNGSFELVRQALERIPAGPIEAKVKGVPEGEFFSRLEQPRGLNPEAEPEIYATTEKFATVIENMVYDEETKELDFEDDSLTANMRCAYPLHYISNASATAKSQHKNLSSLTRISH